MRKSIAMYYAYRYCILVGSYINEKKKHTHTLERNTRAPIQILS